jgi:hypothetical protein
MNQPTYYLFGSTATEFFFENEGKSAKKIAKSIISEMDYHVFCYEELYNHPSELLAEYDGWDGFAIINEELFTLLVNNLNK